MENEKICNIGLIGTVVGAIIMTIGMFGGYIIGLKIESLKMMYIGLDIFRIGIAIFLGGISLVLYYDIFSYKERCKNRGN